ncbi:MAG: HAMP domain-containing histidine kinase [Blastochloris sp.]|nr:HAMP domain-containing histidine kinase [Blastochloris sp.]
MAHELKNPITSIRGYAELLLRGGAGDISEPQQQFLSTIRFNADRMTTLISDLNDVTQLQTDNLRIELAPMDFRRVVTETLRPLQKQIDDKGQSTILDMPDDLPQVQGDSNRLIQVMTNLLSNAHKYTPEGGKIVVGAVLRRDCATRRGVCSAKCCMCVCRTAASA